MKLSSSPAFLPTTTSMNKDSERKKKSIFLSFEERECSVCHGVAVCDGDCCSNSSFDTRSITTHSCDTILLQQQEDEDEDDNIVTNMSQSCRSILRDPSHTNTDSSTRTSTSTSTSKGSQRVSFAENIATVHSVQNLKLSLTRKERKRIWDTPRDSLFDITDVFYEDDEDYDESMSMESRLGDVFGAIGSRSKKGQKEKKQSQERNKQKQQQHQQHQQQQSNSRKSMLRSLASRFSIRKKRRLTKIAVREWTENARVFSET